MTIHQSYVKSTLLLSYWKFKYSNPVSRILPVFNTLSINAAENDEWQESVNGFKDKLFPHLQYVPAEKSQLACGLNYLCNALYHKSYSDSRHFNCLILLPWVVFQNHLILLTLRLPLKKPLSVFPWMYFKTFLWIKLY